MGQEPVHYGILAIDIEGFGRQAWTDPIRARLRARLHRLLDDAFAQAGITWSQIHQQDTGDGVLLLVAGEVPATRLLYPLGTVLADRLAVDNQVAPTAERLRLRLVAHAGQVIPDPYGHSSVALNHAMRLLNAEVSRAILAGVRDVDIVLLVSEQLYDEVVKQAYPGIDPAAYQAVWVAEKETHTRAWVHLPRLASQPDLAQLPEVRAATRHYAARLRWRRGISLGVAVLLLVAVGLTVAISSRHRGAARPTGPGVLSGQAGRPGQPGQGRVCARVAVLSANVYHDPNSSSLVIKSKSRGEGIELVRDEPMVEHDGVAYRAVKVPAGIPSVGWMRGQDLVDVPLAQLPAGAKACG